MGSARDNILGRLRANRPHAVPAPAVYTKPLGWDRERCIAEFMTRMHAVRGEVHRVARDDWTAWLSRELPPRGMLRGLIGRGAVAEQFAAAAADEFTLTRYDHAIDDWKDVLFRDIDFSVTGTLAGLAESGSLVLWPSQDEPRLMSLVPPLQIALLDAGRLFENFAALLAAEDWSARMPTNALLVSGPSKTADIEQTLAYGIHGPKALIVLILD